MKVPYKIRYVIKRNSITTEKVKDYSKENDVSMMEAKRILSKQSGPTLQYWDEGIFSAFGHGKWVDVPVIVEDYE